MESERDYPHLYSSRGASAGLLSPQLILLDGRWVVAEIRQWPHMPISISPSSVSSALVFGLRILRVLEYTLQQARPALQTLFTTYRVPITPNGQTDTVLTVCAVGDAEGVD